MSYTASALRPGPDGWAGDDVRLHGITDLDGLVESLRELQDDDATLILFLEEDDEYLAIVRVGAENDAQAFVSDARALTGSGVVGRVLGGDVVLPESIGEDDEDDSGRPEIQPAGEPDLLADLGVDSETVLGLCAEEGLLPSDVTYAICERLGCAEVLEAVRGL